MVLFCFISLCSVLGAEGDTIRWAYDGNWNALNDYLYAEYYREAIKQGDGSYIATDYYITGEKQMVGKYTNASMTVRTGDFKYFHKNGELSRKGAFKGNLETGEWLSYHDNGQMLSKGNYKGGKREGEWIWYYKDGDLSEKGNYLAGNRIGEWIAYGDSLGKEVFKGNYEKDVLTGKFYKWHANGQLAQEGTYLKGKREGSYSFYFDNGQKGEEFFYLKGKRTGHWKSWYKDGSLEFEGDFVKDKKEGEWKYFFESGKIASKETYKKGANVDLFFWDEDGKEVNDEDRLYRQATPKGGESRLYDHIEKELEYPLYALNRGIMGLIIVKATITVEGELINPYVSLPGHPCLNEEALRLVKGVENWTPQISHNRPKESEVSIPITFRLNLNQE